MPTTFTQNTGLALQATGENPGAWGSLLNSQDFSLIDAVFGNVQTLTLSGSDITVMLAQTQVNSIVLTGTLTANVSVIFPAIGRTLSIQNKTTGAFDVTLTIAGPGATTIAIPGAAQTYVLDSVNVYLVGVANNDQRFIPTGTMLDYGGATAPTGFILCFGQAISRTTFAALFAVIGTTYGAGDGSTTFNAPDVRGRVLAGQDDMGGTPANRLTNAATGGVDGTTIGNAGGEQAHQLTVAELAQHTHVINYESTQDGTGLESLTKVRADISGTKTGGPKAANTGGNAIHNNVQPTLITNKIIKT